MEKNCITCIHYNVCKYIHTFIEDCREYKAYLTMHFSVMPDTFGRYIPEDVTKDYTENEVGKHIAKGVLNSGMIKYETQPTDDGNIRILGSITFAGDNTAKTLDECIREIYGHGESSQI